LEKTYEVRRLEHILAHRADCKRVYVAALTVHFDDSGTHPEASVAVIGGWIAPFQQWKKFTKEWNKAKAEYGFEEFHTAHFMSNNSESEFADKEEWNENKKKIVMQRLAEITLSRSSQGFCMRVVKKDMDEIIPDGLREVVGRHPYTYALRAAIGFMEGWRKMIGITEPTEYIFDTMTKGPAKTEINRVFEESIRMDDALHKYGIYRGCHSFRDSKTVLPLQAADMMAWLSQRAYAYERQEVSMPEFAITTWNRMLTSRKLFAKSQSREQLREFVAKDPKAIIELPSDWNNNSGRAKRKQSVA
jgi:hypothetical protein